jgi:hypothetical protein
VRLGGVFTASGIDERLPENCERNCWGERSESLDLGEENDGFGERSR